MPVKCSGKNKKLTRREVCELEVKITFMEGIVRRDPKYVEALQILGDHYTQRGKFNHSLSVDQQLSRLEPGNPLVFYNLACSYSLNSEFDLAAAASTRFSRVQRAKYLEFTDRVKTRICLDRDIRSAVGNVCAVNSEGVLARTSSVH